MGALGVGEGDPAFDGERPEPGFANAAAVAAFLVEGAMGAFDLAVLLGGPHGDELVADAEVSEGLLEGWDVHTWGKKTYVNSAP